ncbi:hypothetical protein ZYGR_0I01110 [Zygosaccharomyces rouxii]|uniref:ZYRO0C02706p n=2 Tax=Zygosaccharomyces rouxii TaxID=4956 RepID=C5DSS8_ZYGRC|nr:uncharacterized protein ZYRO0C02706g [Zygosaccharomyces rouxii]KAH9201971.1 inhibitor of apoptosis-promoting Bax1-domain-containing protein [Zygosaccharomyces rouxii]GAV47815.1 hypothetical protein ZYGR_0I01110 [Zygosaccharomyces rouxii]CAR26839.1 ZYRO0C02706p [Zygosaccharomyces rouxii]
MNKNTDLEAQPGGIALSDDFKGAIVVTCDAQVRQRFMAKVYSILSSQLLLSLCFIGAVYRFPSFQSFLINHVFIWVLAMIFTFVSCIWVSIAPSPEEYEENERVPWYALTSRGQKSLLFLFTLCESYCLAGTVMFEAQDTVASALLVTTVVVFGISVMAFSGRFQLSEGTMGSLYGWLGMGIWMLIGIFITSLFFGGLTSRMNVLTGWLGAVVFSVYLFIDTQLIFRKVHVGEEVKCAMMLYLDIVNLFLSLLRIMSNNNDD